MSQSFCTCNRTPLSHRIPRRSFRISGESNWSLCCSAYFDPPGDVRPPGDVSSGVGSSATAAGAASSSLRRPSSAHTTDRRRGRRAPGGDGAPLGIVDILRLPASVDTRRESREAARFRGCHSPSAGLASPPTASSLVKVPARLGVSSGTVTVTDFRLLRRVLSPSSPLPPAAYFSAEASGPFEKMVDSAVENRRPRDGRRGGGLPSAAAPSDTELRPKRTEPRRLASVARATEKRRMPRFRGVRGSAPSSSLRRSCRPLARRDAALEASVSPPSSGATCDARRRWKIDCRPPVRAGRARAA